MFKKVLAVVVGVVAGVGVIFVGDSVTHRLSPMPEGVNFMDKSAVAAYVTTIPTYVLVIMVLFWLLAAFLGAMLAARIRRSEWRQVSLITGGILMAATLLNLVLLPHPAWMWLAALLLYIPAALLGGWLVRKRETEGPR